MTLIENVIEHRDRGNVGRWERSIPAAKVSFELRIIPMACQDLEEQVGLLAAHRLSPISSMMSRL
jgi:hypothetical protein